MSDLFEPTGPHDRRLALRAAGLLGTFNAAGVLTAADVHVARRLAVLAGESDERVLLAVALTTRAVRHGSVCLDLAFAATTIAPDADLPWPATREWVRALEASPLLAAGVLRWEFGLLYLDRYRGQEVQVVEDLASRAARPAPELDGPAVEATLGRIFAGESYDEQRSAARLVVSRWTSVLTGGPGTGKTTTIAGLLAVLAEQAAARGEALRIALTAPTGKAAARLQESVHTELAGDRYTDADRERLSEVSAATLHRLLGTRRDNGTRFMHHRGNRLPHDVVVVDETSMVSLTMMARLVEAVRPDARLVLVGDADQLASVDAGAVLADLVAGLGGEDGMVAQLQTNHRSAGQIIPLAEAIRAGDADAALGVLGSGAAEVEFGDDPDALRAEVVQAALDLRHAALAGDVARALEVLEGHRLLCAHREGPHGVRHWNRQVEAWLTEATSDPLWDEWYAGRPVLVTANDYGLGIHNGDTGVTVVRNGALRVFIQGATQVHEFAPGRLDDVETMHAMTIHKAQGSQARSVSVLLPEEDSRLLTRELLYTAVTRAQAKVRVIGSTSVVREAVERRAVRATGLRHRLA